METDGGSAPDFTKLTAEVVAAYLRKHTVEAAALPELIAAVARAFLQGTTPPPAPVAAAPLVPAVPVRKSVTDEFIVCLEDGKRFKSLRRHLLASYGMTPADYRTKWDLPADYPMVAPAYAAARSALAKAIGLGSSRKKVAAEALTPAPEPVVEPAKPTPKRRKPRKAKVTA